MSEERLLCESADCDNKSMPNSVICKMCAHYIDEGRRKARLRNTHKLDEFMNEHRNQQSMEGSVDE